MKFIVLRAERRGVTFAAVDVTLRVGAQARVTNPPSDSPLRGLLPVTGASLVAALVAIALAMVLLGTLVLAHSRQEQR
jgi:hypothetical protein